MAGQDLGAAVRARNWLFWLHLAIGVVAGTGIFTMSVTGAVLALQPQILEWLEREQRVIPPPVGAERLAPSALLSAATAGENRLDSVALTIPADLTEAALVSLGRDRVRFVDPYRGTVTGEGAGGARRAFQWLTEFHRWFATPSEWRASARSVTGWSTFAFVLLIVSGFVLWIPRRISGMSLARAATPAWPVTVRARYFNWHTVVGFWCAPVLLVLAVSGVVLAFPWANRLLYTAAGSPLPQAVQRTENAPAAGGRAAAQARAVATRPDYRAVDTAWASAVAHLPAWRSIVVRIPARAEMPLSFTITEAAHWNRFARSQMTVSGKTGEVLRWEPYDEASRGQKWRGWARFAHTGELGGLTGQVLAGVASAGAALLVWTGMSLALRRLLRSSSGNRGVVGTPVAAVRPLAPIPEAIRQVEQS